MKFDIRVSSEGVGAGDGRGVGMGASSSSFIVDANACTDGLRRITPDAGVDNLASARGASKEGAFGTHIKPE